MDIETSIESSEAFASGGYVGVALTALLIIVVSVVISELLVRFVNKAYHITRGDHTGSILSLIIRIAVYGMGFYMLFKNCFNIDLSVLIGALGVGGVALSLGLQDTIKNALGGLQITFSKELEVGDWIKVGGVEGAVIDINLRHTTLVDDIAQTHVIPNSILNSSTFTRMPKFFRVPLSLALSREVDFANEAEAICKIADKAMVDNDLVFEDKKSTIIVSSVGTDGVNATLVVFARWDCSGAQVKDAVMAEVLSYLQSKNIVARWS